jgi:hypothetical protein
MRIAELEREAVDREAARSAEVDRAIEAERASHRAAVAEYRVTISRLRAELSVSYARLPAPPPSAEATLAAETAAAEAAAAAGAAAAAASDAKGHAAAAPAAVAAPGSATAAAALLESASGLGDAGGDADDDALRAVLVRMSAEERALWLEASRR